MTTDRVFKAVDRHGATIEFELVKPNLAAENEGERQYRIAFSRALTEGVFPREKMAEVMRQHQMWTDDDDRHMQAAVAKIAIMQIELETAQKAGDEAKCINLAREIAEQRNRMWELFLIQQSVYMNSAEGVAEAIKQEAIMAACTVVKATGDKYWPTYKDFVIERDGIGKSTVYESVVSVQSGLLDDVKDELLEQYPERKYMQDIKDQLLDKDIDVKVKEELTRRAEAVQEERVEESKPKRKVAKKKATKRKTTVRKSE